MKRGREFTIFATLDADHPLTLDEEVAKSMSDVIKKRLEDGFSDVMVPGCKHEALKFIFTAKITTAFLARLSPSVKLQMIYVSHYLDMKLEDAMFGCWNTSKALRAGLHDEIDDFWFNEPCWENPAHLPPQVHVEWNGVEPCTAINVPMIVWKDRLAKYKSVKLPMWHTHPRMYHIMHASICKHMLYLAESEKNLVKPKEWNTYLEFHIDWTIPWCNNAIDTNFFTSQFFVKRKAIGAPAKGEGEWGRLSRTGENMFKILNDKIFEGSESQWNSFVKKMTKRERDRKNKALLRRKNIATLTEWITEAGFCNWKACAAITPSGVKSKKAWLSNSLVGIAKSDPEWQEFETLFKDETTWTFSLDLMKSILPEEAFKKRMMELIK